MEKTAKITSVQENQRQFNYQGTDYYEHWIKYEGSENVHVYNSKTPVCEKFKVGQEATFTVEVKQNGQYTNYKIKPVQANGFAGKKSEPKDSGAITFLSCFSSACNFYASRGQVTHKDVLDLTELAFQEAMKHSTLPK